MNEFSPIYPIRQNLRNLLLSILSLNSKPSNGIHILNGHKFSALKNDSMIFLKLMNTLSEYVDFINFEDAVDLIIKRVRPNKPLVAFSFDDGFEECYTVIAPILELFHVNAAFFVNPNYVSGDVDYILHFNRDIVRTLDKKPMRWDQIIDLSNRGFIIGAHTMDHYMINDGCNDILEFQIGSCKKIIEEKTNRTCDYFAFPYGRLDQVTKKSLEIAKRYYSFVFSQSNYKSYFSFDGIVINRRHFEPDWNINHVKYFLSAKKKY